MSSQNHEGKRIYQVWPGNNRFYCGGRLVFGPDASSLLLTASMIGGPAITFCVRMVYLIGHRYPAFHSLLLMGAVMITILDFVFLFLTSSRDPGIIPRNKEAPEAETPQAISQSLEWVSNKAGKAKLPRTKDITVNGFSVKVKFCDTCQLYRPPRASHCSICNNCVQRFDHHCPWVGQCIALRNYPFFVCFLSCSTLLCIYVFVFSCICMLEVHGQFYLVLADDLILGALVLYCFVSVWFVGGLTVFHFYLICTNQTTCENFRYHYDKNENPYRKGILQNLKELFFTKIPPSLINFRDWAPEEEDDVEVGSIASERGRAYSPRDTDMSSGKPDHNNIDLRLQNQEYGNKSDAAVQEISVDEGATAIGSVDQEPANLRRNSSVDVRSR
ncbi:unnamed protein product [Arabis nemorensis]|uniref:S-acyltransferase n=1 Tax=Arabis nemorensis TaxID=586526 RepID=A0A565BX49_9BRAS|nr:unnamed protein product [Arabis nemorensis]